MITNAKLFLACVCCALIQPGFAAPDPSTYLPGQLVVKYKSEPGKATRQAVTQLAGARIKATLPRLNCQVLELPAGMSVTEAVDFFQSQPDVAYAEPNYRIRLFAESNDPKRDSQWHLNLIGATNAWAQTQGDASIVVAVVDTGIDYRHPDIAANVWTNPSEIPDNKVDDDRNGYVDDVHGVNMVKKGDDVLDDDGHGTHVAGIIGGVGNNQLGIAGINWQVSMLTVKIFTADDTAGTAEVAESYDYLVALKKRGVNIRVANNSWGSPVPSMALFDAMRDAEAVGILSVCAAGNDNHNTDDRPEFPAGLDCESLISVAATTREDKLASYSNYGAVSVDLAAPGSYVLSAYRGMGPYQEMSGTSMACPQVAGAAALLLAKNSALTPLQLKRLLMATVDPLPGFQDRVRSGGRLNVGNAMARLLSGLMPVSTPETNNLAPSFPRITGLSLTSEGRWGMNASLLPSISSNGNFIAFLSYATNLVARNPGTALQAYLHDRTAGTTVFISGPSGGGVPNGACSYDSGIEVSDDGRFVVFASKSSNLAPGDSNNDYDVFCYDREAGTLELISTTGSGAGNGGSDFPSISGDGRYVVFASEAANLVANGNSYRNVLVRDRQLRTTTRVSANASGVTANYHSDLPSISGDGRYITFLSGADNLVSDAYFPAFHLYLKDRVSGAIQRISKSASGAAGNTNSGRSTLSADGRFIAFESRASNLVPGDTNKAMDVFLFDRVARVLKMVSRGNDGVQANSDCWSPSISLNGRHVLFFTDASTLCRQDDDPSCKIFDYDRLSAKSSRLSYNMAGLPAIGDAFLPTTSADGRFVAFDSSAWNLVPGDGNATRDIFLLDRGEAIPDLMISAVGETNRQGMGLHGVHIMQRRSLALTNATASFNIRLDNDGPTNATFNVRANPAPAGWSAQFLRGTTNVTAAITGDGLPVTLAAGTNVLLRLDVSSLGAGVGESWAEWLITAASSESNAAADAVRAVVTRTPSPPSAQLLSRATDGRPGNDSTASADCSADARYVVFSSTASDLTPQDYNLQLDVFLLDRQTQGLECLSKSSAGSIGNGRSHGERISRDGHYVVFQSTATNLVAGDTNDREDVFVYDRLTRVTTRASLGPDGRQSLRDSGSASISGDGRYIAFESLADNFVAGDTNRTWDIFLRDTVAGTVQCLSMAGNQTGNDESLDPVISSDGSLVVFTSLANNLAETDTNEVRDVFLWQRGVPGLRLLSRTADGATGDGPSAGTTLSDDNRYVLFSSRAENLAVPAFDTNSIIYLFDRQTSQLSQINPPRVAGRQHGSFYGPRLAPNGRLITLMADVAPQQGGTNYMPGLFLYDRITGAMQELTALRNGTPGNDSSVGGPISADGRFVLMATRASNLLGETLPALDQLLLRDLASFQPDEWIRRSEGEPYRGVNQLTDAQQRIEQTIRPAFTNIAYLTIRNRGTFPDRFLFKARNPFAGADCRYYVQATGLEITKLATNAGWTSDVLPSGGTCELRLRVVASKTNIFTNDMVFTTTSLTDPTKIDVVRLRFLRDDDNDRLPNSWEQQFFLSSTNAAALADSDGDGYSNLDEYRAGTDPKNAASSLRITRIQPGPGSTVTLGWSGATNRYYTIERSTGIPGGFSPAGEVFGAGPELIFQDSVPAEASPAFYRLRVDLP